MRAVRPGRSAQVDNPTAVPAQVDTATAAPIRHGRRWIGDLVTRFHLEAWANRNLSPGGLGQPQRTSACPAPAASRILSCVPCPLISVVDPGSAVNRGTIVHPIDHGAPIHRDSRKIRRIVGRLKSINSATPATNGAIAPGFWPSAAISGAVISMTTELRDTSLAPAVPLIWFIDGIAADRDTMGAARIGWVSRIVLMLTFIGLAGSVVAISCIKG
jgi:hypothetical protein